jgi:AcrR family transcriptional regulator
VLFRSTSTEEIAQKVGLTKGAFYFHFKSKEDILFALIKSMTDGFRETLDSLRVDQWEPGEMVKAILDRCEFTGPKQFRSVLDIWVQAMSVPRIRKYINKERRERVALFCRMVKPPRGWTKRELEQLAVMTFSLVDGLSAQRVLDVDIVDTKIQARLFQAMFCSCCSSKPGTRK